VEASLFSATSIHIYRTTRHGILKDIYPHGHRHEYHKYQNPALYTFVTLVFFFESYCFIVVFENMVLRRIFGPRKDEVTGGMEEIA